jgi:hypothetical protein
MTGVQRFQRSCRLPCRAITAGKRRFTGRRLTGPAVLGREGFYPHLPKLLLGVSHRTKCAAPASRTHISGLFSEAARSIDFRHCVNWIDNPPQRHQKYPRTVKTELTESSNETHLSYIIYINKSFDYINNGQHKESRIFYSCK